MVGNRELIFSIFKEHGYCYEVNQDECEPYSVRCILNENSIYGCGREASCPPNLYMFPAPQDQ